MAATNTATAYYVNGQVIDALYLNGVKIWSRI